MTVKRQTKHLGDGLVIKLRSAHGHVGTSRRRRIGTIKQGDACFELASQKSDSQDAFIEQKNDSLSSPAESFRRGWKEIMSGDTIPLSKLWEEFEKE